jgi:phage protein D
MRPAARIMMDGTDITANLLPAPFGLPLEGGGRVIGQGFLEGRAPLLGLTVTDNEGKKSDTAELEISNKTYIPSPKKGAKLQIWLGYSETGIAYMGSYLVDSWTKASAPRRLMVSAKAIGFTTDIKAPKSRSYHKTTVGEIVNKVAQKHGLRAIVHSELKGIKIGHIDQSAESDANFLTRLAKRVGGIFKLADGNVIFHKAGSATLPSGGAAPVVIWPETGLLSWTATGSERGSYKSSSASWINTETGERETVVKGSGKPRHTDRKLYKTQEEAEIAAQAQLSALNRGRVSYNSDSPGRTDVFASMRLQVVEHDPDVDGLFNVKTVVNRLGADGYRTTTTAESTNEGGDDKE